MAHQNPQHTLSVENSNIVNEFLSPTRNEITATDLLELGMIYFNAHHIEWNCLVAFDWIKLSAEQGNAKAQFRLAELYSLGLDIPKSHTDAYKWYTKAAIQGYKKASGRIHNLYQEDIRMHSRGKLDSQEKLREKPKKDKEGEDEKPEYYYRELYEQRLDDHKLVLNHAIEYYTDQFEKYKSSNQEDPEIQQNLGFLYQHGYGIKKYEKWAIEYYTKAAEQGYVDSQYQLGSLYQKNTDIKFNYKKAYHWYCLAAMGGNVAAQNQLGYFYEKGLGTNIDYTQALYWYTKAAESGHSMAQLTLGKWYRKGCYVGVDYSMAVKWYTLAARQGNSVAQNCLVQLYQKEKIGGTPYESDILHYSKDGSKEGRLCSKLQADILKIKDQLLAENLKKLAKRALIGDGNAMYEIGLKYYNGTDLNENKLIGLKWIKNAADTGYKDALFKVTNMYEEGDTIQQGFHKVAMWTKKHAKQKNDIAQCKLGILYKEGRGVRCDSLEASKWFTLSANQENSEAQYQLGCLRQTGSGLRKNEEEALEWFNFSAKQGDINGCYALAIEYFYENRSKIDEATALRLLEYSAKRGNENAQYEMWEYYSRKKEKPKIDFYFDMLIQSNNTYLIDKALTYLMSREDSDIDYIKYFKCLKKAAGLGNLLAKSFFQTPMNITEELTERMLPMYIVVLDKDISSTECYVGYIYENFGSSVNYDYDMTEVYKAAIYWYKISARKGDSRAQVRLGVMCEEGKGTDVNFKMAVSYYTSAYKKKNEDAMYRLACMYLYGRGITQNIKKAFELYTQAADMGQIEARKLLMLPCHALDEDSSEYKYYQHLAVEISNDDRMKMLEEMATSGLVSIQYQLGVFYENRDNLKALKWFILAAHGGVTDAFYRLGVLYEKGEGIEQVYSQSINFYEKAILSEHEGAMYRLAQIHLYGKGTEINYKKAYQLYKKASEMGHNLSCKILGIYSGTDGDPSITYSNSEEVKILFDPLSNEFKHVLLMFQHIAKEGDVELQYKLGVIYESIFNTPNYEEAVKWYSMAANNSHREAMYRLGLLFEAGVGVAQDYQKAIQLYNQAYKLGNYDALYRLGMVYHHGTIADIDYEKAIQFYKEAANNGHLKSQHMVGMLYEKGSLVERNILEALKWYTRAYLKGHDPAKTDLYAIYDDPPFDEYFVNKLNTFLFSISEKILVSGIEKYDDSYGVIFYRLGIQHLFGNGVPQDFEESLKCFKVASDTFKNSTARDLINMKYSGNRDLFLIAIDMYETLFAILESSQRYSLAMVYYNGVLNTTKNCIDDPDPVKNKNTGPIFDEGSNNQDVILATDYKKAISLFKNIQGDHYNKAHVQLAKMYTRGHGVEKNIETAIEHYIKASKYQPNYYAFEIAQIYHFDNSFCDFTKAIEWYEKADDYKKGAALNTLGLIYKSGKGVNQDYEKSLQYFIKLSREADKYLFYNLGLMHYHGNGTAQNYAKAYNYFKKVAKEGHVKVQIYLANMYLNGYGVEKNVKKAKEIYKKAFDSTDNNKNIGIADVSDFIYLSEAIEWLKEIERHDPVISLDYRKLFDTIEYHVEPPEDHTDYSENQTELAKVGAGFSFRLGKLYYKGEGVEIDYRNAYIHLMKAAEAGSSDAQKMLAEMYACGHGVEGDMKKALEWYTKALKDEPNLSALDIVNLYYTNYDFRDDTKALTWYENAKSFCENRYSLYSGLIYRALGDSKKALCSFDIASRCRNIDAWYNIGEMYYIGEGVDKNFYNAYIYLKAAANENHSRAQLKLAEMYTYGRGVEKDIKKVIEWYTKASEDEPDRYASTIARLYEDDDDFRDYKKAIEWYAKAAESGSDYAAISLGELYHYNNEVQDFSKAFEWYHKVKKDNNKRYALRGIGLLFEHGDGVTQDYEKSVEYYQQSTELRNEIGFYNLALMYYYGKGVDQDYKKCFDLLNESIEQRLFRNKTHVFVRAEGDLSTNTVGKSRIYSLESETILHREIYFQLGNMHENGQGTPQDDIKAKECFLMAQNPRSWFSFWTSK